MSIRFSRVPGNALPTGRRWRRCAVVTLLIAAAWLLASVPSRADCSFTNTGNERFGVGSNGRITDFDHARLGIGWYHNWGYYNHGPAGLEFYGTVGAFGHTVAQDSAAIEQQMSLRPDRYPDGMRWFVGNEVGWDDGFSPAQYAQHYHDWHSYLKGLNSTFQIGPGAMLPLFPAYWDGMTGIEWLTEVRVQYQSLYSEEMPVDYYNMHVYFLPWDHDEFFYTIQTFRQAMADQWSARSLPLIITEMGTLDIEETATMQTLMVQALDFVSTATSDVYGCTADGNRLVQKWAWFALTGWSPDDGNHHWDLTALFNYDTRDIMPLGVTYSNYTGTYTNFAPVTSDLEPVDSSVLAGFTKTITTTHCDANGWNHLSEIQFLINDTPDHSGSLYAKYDRLTGLFYLRNDADTAWLGGYSPGSPNDVENGVATLHVRWCRVYVEEAGITIRWSLSFKPAFGTKVCNLYTHIEDLGAQIEDWRAMGSLNVYASNDPPQHGIVAPSDGSGSAATFTTTCSDPNGEQDLRVVRFRINGTPINPNGFQAYYVQDTNEVQVLSDDASSWIGPLPVGTPNVLENSQGSLDLLNMTVLDGGDTLTVTWPISFKQTFTGDKILDLRIRDQSGAVDDWAQVGTWTVANSPPFVGSVDPNAGACNPGQKVSFVTTVGDPDGWQQAKFATFAIGQNQSGSDGLYAYYSQNSNKVYLGNDEGTGWIGGLPPGTPQVIENSRVILHLVDMSVSGSGDTLSITWYVTFKLSVSGSKNVYLKAWDDWNAKAAWQQVGTWTIQNNQRPARGTVTPGTGSCDAGEKVAFSTTWSDANGWQDIKFACFAIGRHLSGADGLSAYYNQNANLVYLSNDDGTAWIGKLPPGSAQTIENSRLILHLEDMSVSGVGDTLTVNWSVTFKPLVSGPKYTYLNVWDDQNVRSGWRRVGEWQVTGTNQPPTADSVVPNTGACDPGQSIAFATTVSDPNGWPQVKFVPFAIGQDSSGSDGLKAYYSFDAHRVYLSNDEGTAWIGALPPGSAQTIENSRVTLNLQDMFISREGLSLTVHWSVAFKATVAGEKNIYLNVWDDLNAKSRWQQMGTWSVNGVGAANTPVTSSKAGQSLEPVDDVPAAEDIDLPVLEPIEEKTETPSNPATLMPY